MDDRQLMQHERLADLGTRLRSRSVARPEWKRVRRLFLTYTRGRCISLRLPDRERAHAVLAGRAAGLGRRGPFAHGSRVNELRRQRIHGRSRVFPLVAATAGRILRTVSIW